MAKQVHDVLIQLIQEHRGLSREAAEEIVKNMRSSCRYQVRLCLEILRKCYVNMYWHVIRLRIDLV